MLKGLVFSSEDPGEDPVVYEDEYEGEDGYEGGDGDEEGGIA